MQKELLHSPVYNVIFFGTPEFALPPLKMLQARSDVRVCAVITQPDRPKGRGGKLTAAPVKDFALLNNIPVFQPEKLRGAELNSLVASLEKLTIPDIGVCVAYGNIIPKLLLEFPQRGIVNIHASLLPRWRGAAPIQHCILEGDLETGVCIMQLAEGLDTGAVYSRTTFSINESDNYQDLHDRLSAEGARLLDASLEGICNCEITSEPQSEIGIRYAHKWTNEDLQINFAESAMRCARRVRASSPFPGARAVLSKDNIESATKIFSARVAVDKNYVDKNYHETRVGKVVSATSEEIVVACGDGSYLGIMEMQLPGRKRMLVSELLRGYPIKVGDFFKG